MSNNNNNHRESIFELVDGVVNHLSSMRKMFLIMIITAAIMPPMLMLGIIISVDPPSDSAQVVRGKILLEQLRNNEISQEEFISEMEYALEMPPIVFGNGLILYLIILGVAFSWLGYGIKKWFFISKWRSKYERFKEKRNKVDEMLEDEFENEN